jgi:protein gp37
MGEKSNISWTDATFNIVWGCEKISPGCANCYAAETAVDDRLGYKDKSGEFVKLWGAGSTRRILSDGYWRQLAKWNRKAREAGKVLLVFSSSMADFFEDHPLVNDQRERFWDMTKELEWLQFQLVTKRPENIGVMLPPWWDIIAGRHWLGTSVENQDYAGRVDHVLKHASGVKFVSYEPALGFLKFDDGILGMPDDSSRIGWVIYGGESGETHRMDADAWAESMAWDCRAHGTAFWMKQHAGRIPGLRPEVFGQKIQIFPKPDETLAEHLDERFAQSWANFATF